MSAFCLRHGSESHYNIVQFWSLLILCRKSVKNYPARTHEYLSPHTCYIASQGGKLKLFVKCIFFIICSYKSLPQVNCQRELKLRKQKQIFILLKHMSKIWAQCNCLYDSYNNVKQTLVHSFSFNLNCVKSFFSTLGIHLVPRCFSVQFYILKMKIFLKNFKTEFLPPPPPPSTRGLKSWTPPLHGKK